MIRHFHVRTASDLPLQQGSSGVLDYADGRTRASLAQTFEVKFSKSDWPAFTLVVNHFKSKGSDCDGIDDPDTGDGQASKQLYGVFVTQQDPHTHTPNLNDFPRSLCRLHGKVEVRTCMPTSKTSIVNQRMRQDGRRRHKAPR